MYDDYGATKSSRRLATGPEEARLLTELERRGIAVLSLPRHRALLDDFGAAPLRHLVHSLSAKGWLLRIERGKYAVVPRAARGVWSEHPFVIAAAIAPERHYISYWSALSYHGLTEQLPRVVYVATRDKQKRAVAFQGWRYQFVRRSPATFFGYRVEEFTALNGAATVEVPVAEPEKSILDALDDERLSGGMSEVVKAIRRGLEDATLDVERLLDQGRRYPVAAVVARLGYILDHFGVAQSRDLLPLVRRAGAPPYLSTKAPRAAAPLDPTWYLRVNLPDDLFAREEAA
jgi:predicted transcriptional regulator of viral defense system